jgi:hypothetical protein
MRLPRARPALRFFLLHGAPLALRLRNRLELALKTSHPEIHEALRRDHPDLFRIKWIADVRHTGSGKPALR